MRLKDKTVLVTGATSGIGQCVALRCAEEGADLIITYAHHHEAALMTQLAIQALGRRCEVVKLHLSSLEDISNIERAVISLGKIHVLVNNAGIVRRTPFIDISPKEYDEMMETNLKGTFFLTQAITKNMIKQGGEGSIIHISSISDEILSPHLSHYQISKAGISMLSKSAAYELAKHRIRVNTIAPGLVKTEMNRHQWESAPEVWQRRTQAIPLGRVGDPNDIANAVLYFASDESRWVTGTRIEVDGGSHLL